MDNCVFCRIIRGELPADVIFESEQIIAFTDAHPLAPTHVLVVPKKHIVSLDDLTDSDTALGGELLLAIKEVAARAGVSGGYKVVTNCGESAGQVVPHLHFHVLGGKKFVP